MDDVKNCVIELADAHIKLNKNKSKYVLLKSERNAYYFCPCSVIQKSNLEAFKRGMYLHISYVENKVGKFTYMNVVRIANATDKQVVAYKKIFENCAKKRMEALCKLEENPYLY